MADFPFRLASPDLQARLAAAFDREGKIPRALAELGPLEDRSVVVLDGDDGVRASQLGTLGARVAAVPGRETRQLPDDAADVLIGCWSVFAPSSSFDEELADAGRVLRPGGRLLVVHDYGRDDASRLLWDESRRHELIEWSRRDGWFIARGFRIRVVHCWWHFDSLGDAAGLLGAAFGRKGEALASELRRPRLSHNVAIYHRTFDGS